MNKNSFFIGLCISLIAVFCAGALEPMTEHCYTSSELVKNIMAICQNEYGDKYDDCAIFIKNGVISLGNVRKWYLKDENRFEKLDEAYAYFFNQCKLGNLINCRIMIQLPVPLQEYSINGEFLVAGTADCESSKLVKEYIEQNIRYDSEVDRITFPKIDMSGKDLFSQR